MAIISFGIIDIVAHVFHGIVSGFEYLYLSGNESSLPDKIENHCCNDNGFDILGKQNLNYSVMDCGSSLFVNLGRDKNNVNQLITV